MSRSLPLLIVTLTLVSLTSVRCEESCPDTCQCDVTENGGMKAVCQGGVLASIIKALNSNFTSLSLSRAVNLRTLRPIDFPMDSEISLTSLSITESYVQDIQDGTFRNLRYLEELDLSYNNIATIRQHAFSNLDRLKVLNLMRNKLANMASVLQSLYNLEKLDLSYNHISDLHTGAFRSQKNLVFLRLDGNGLQNLHGYVFQGLQTLEHLSLRKCQLNSIGRDMFNIVRNIQILDLGQNQIQQLPPSEEFRNLPSLRHLRLDNNAITELKPSQFSGITLDTLLLSHNQIRSISYKAFQYFNTRVLDISNNILQEIQDGFLKPTAPQLEHLIMSGNPLRHVSKFAFDGLYRLEELILSNCLLERLDKDQFRKLQNLKKLDISWNKLKSIPRDLLDGLRNSVVVILHKNSWNCDCFIKPLKQWLEHTHMDMPNCQRDPQHGNQCLTEKCHAPASLVNMQIRLLEETEIAECRNVTSTSDQLPVSTQAAIVVSCLLVAIFFIAVALMLWRRGKTKDHLRRQCIKADSEPVSSHQDFLEEKKPPLFDSVSLGESDRNFVFRKYFQTMPSNPDLFQEITSLRERSSQVGADSVYSSMPSINSSNSCNLGIESTV